MAKRYDQKVLQKWFDEPGLASTFEKFSDYDVKCLVCSRASVLPVLINIKSRGKCMLYRHTESTKHCQIAGKTKSSTEDSQTTLDQCVSKKKKVNKAHTALILLHCLVF